MNHNEAVEQMAVERYLLNELAPDARDDFEEHMFGCQECALDTRVANVFIEEAKAQLSKIAPGRAKVANAGTSTKAPSKWLTWWRPAFAAPAFAALLVVIGYQNLVTLPSLRTSESEPSVVPSAPVYGATRGGARTAITANRELGISLPVDLPLDPRHRQLCLLFIRAQRPRREVGVVGVDSGSSSQLLGRCAVFSRHTRQNARERNVFSLHFRRRFRWKARAYRELRLRCFLNQVVCCIVWQAPDVAPGAFLPR